ncbi:DsbA family protein [Angustibacter aerolatus]
MTSGRSARDERAEKVAAARAAAARAERRRRLGIVVGAVAAVVVVVLGVTLLVQRSQGSGTPTQTAAQQAAAPRSTSGAANAVVTTGRATAPVTVTLYEDFQCPACRAFETTTGPTLQQLVDAGTVKVEYHPIAFLDRASSTRYSSRALNAAACLVDRDPSRFEALHDELFAQQPEEGSAGLPDSTLVSLTAKAGVSGLQQCIEQQQFAGWVARVTDQSSKDGVNQTPTVLVAGKELADRTPAGLTAAVRAAQQ